jgi:hypothetical protein
VPDPGVEEARVLEEVRAGLGDPHRHLGRLLGRRGGGRSQRPDQTGGCNPPTHPAGQSRTISALAPTVHQLEEEALDAFAFLETDFGCERAGVEGDGWWRRLIYRSNTGFAEIYLDEREEMVSVYFGAAGGDKLPLWAVLDARGEAQPDRTDVRAWAEALRRHGAEALRGDASGYTGLEEAYARHADATERLIADYMEELRRRRTSR